MEEENETNIKLFKVVILFVESLIVGLCFLFFVGVAKVDAAPYVRDRKDPNASWSQWEDYSNWIGTDTTIYNLQMTTTHRSWLQFKDDVAMLSGKSYNFSGKIIVTYNKLRTSDISSNLAIELYNGSSLISTGDKCSVAITSNSVIVAKQYVFNFSCIALEGSGYYPYLSLQAHGDEAFTKDVKFVISEWEYHLNTASQDANSIINNNNQNTEIITDNNNQNTQDIINNQNQNTQDIIDNQNQNSQNEIESQKACKEINKNSVVINNKYLNSSGGQSEATNRGITDYINIYQAQIKVLNPYNVNDGLSVCYYNIDKALLSCETLYNKTELTIPNNTYYMRSSINTARNLPTYQICKNGNQAMNDSINDLNDSLTSDDIDTSLFSGFDVDVSDTGIVGIITSPLNAISNILSNTCSDITAPIPFTNKNFTLPCLTPIYNQHFPTILAIWQTVVTGVIAYWVCLNIFHMVHGFSDPNDDKIEVLEL